MPRQYTPGDYLTSYNAGRSTLAAAIVATDQTVTLHSGDGALFPSNAPFFIAIGATTAAFEVVQVVNRSTDTLTVERGVTGSPAGPSAWASGTAVEYIDGPGDPWGIGTVQSNITTLQTALLPVLKGNAAQALAASGTIATASLAVSRVTPGASCTGVILAAGTSDGQVVIVENHHASNTATFAAAGTSNVANGASEVVAALTSSMYVWNATAALWYSVK